MGLVGVGEAGMGLVGVDGVGVMRGVVGTGVGEGSPPQATKAALAPTVRVIAIVPSVSVLRFRARLLVCGVGRGYAARTRKSSIAPKPIGSTGRRR